MIARLLAYISVSACLLTASLAAQAYSQGEFETALEGYFLSQFGAHSQAAVRLHRSARSTANMRLYEDAVNEALLGQDLDMALSIADEWYKAGGGVLALRHAASLQVTKYGLQPARKILIKLATETNPRTLYIILKQAVWKDEAAEFMAAIYPPDLRNTSFWSHLALLQLRGPEGSEAAAESIGTALAIDPSSLDVLIVALVVAEQDDEGSTTRINLVERLATASNLSFAEAFSVYSIWHAQFLESGVGLPEDFVGYATSLSQQRNADFYDRSQLAAGQFLLANKAPARALKYFEQISSNSPYTAHALRYSLRASDQLDQPAKAQQLISQALATASPDRLPDIILVAAWQAERTAGPQAAYDLLANQPLLTTNLSLLYQRSIYAEEAGRLDLAENDLREYIRLSPEDAEGYNALGYIFADNKIKLNEAAILLDKAMLISPNAPNIIDSYGWLLYRQGKLSEALEQLTKAMRKFGAQPPTEVSAHVGEVLWVQGNREQAKEIWQRALAIETDNKILRETIIRFNAFDL